MTNNIRDRLKEFIKRKHIPISEESINKMFNSYDRKNIEFVR